MGWGVQDEERGDERVWKVSCGGEGVGVVEVGVGCSAAYFEGRCRGAVRLGSPPKAARPFKLPAEGRIPSRTMSGGRPFKFSAEGRIP